MILLLSGCLNSAVKTEEIKQIVPPPMLKSTIITDGEWKYTFKGLEELNTGTWYHLHEDDITNLILYIHQVSDIK